LIITLSNYKKRLQSFKIQLKEKDKELGRLNYSLLSLKDEIIKYKNLYHSHKKSDKYSEMVNSFIENRSYYKAMCEVSYRKTLKYFYRRIQIKNQSILKSTPRVHRNRI
jgi:hypothetical protein